MTQDFRKSDPRFFLDDEKRRKEKIVKADERRMKEKEIGNSRFKKLNG